MIIQSIIDIAEICIRKQVYDAIISPGSRNAHLTIAFARHPHINTYVIPDERSAAYIAFGMAQQSGRPAVLICTSGTAAINYYPAITEAYYQNVPLLVLTADRPQEWIDQQDGQTVRQFDLYKNHIKRSFQFPDYHQPSIDHQWYSNRMVNEAINIATTLPCGPVHINVPIREPFYPKPGERINYRDDIKIVEDFHQVRAISGELIERFTSYVQRGKVLFVAGQGTPDIVMQDTVDQCAKKFSIPLIADIISNHGHLSNAIRHHDAFLKFAGNDLQPDLMITFGRSVISKNLKLYLRQFKPREHWHICHNDFATDTYQSLTHVVGSDPTSFFRAILNIDLTITDDHYMESWKKYDEQSARLLPEVLGTEKWGEFAAVSQIMKHLPEKCILHLANSMPVRYANFINTEKDIEVFANRGTSGIDGCLSTAVGHAIKSNKLNILLTGDMAFFYDRNGLWQQHLPGNLLIIVLNNHGGGIFRLIDGPSRQPELEEFFETRNPISAANTAKDHGLQYFHCNNQKDLESFLSDLSKHQGPAILEIETDKYINQQVFQHFNLKFKEHYGA